MTPENFCYWLQGFFELSDPDSLTHKEVEMIKNHLNLVFEHSIDPKATANIKDPKKAKEIQDKLSKVHNPLDPNTVYRC